MYIHCTDDEDAGIMDLSQALDLSDQAEDTQPLNLLEKQIMAKRKTAAAAPAAPAAAPAAPAKKTKKAAAAPAAPEPKPEPAGGPRAVPEGHTGLADVATKVGITAASARRKLRGMEGMSKPEGQHGWYWKTGSKELAAIEKALTPEPAAK